MCQWLQPLHSHKHQLLSHCLALFRRIFTSSGGAVPAVNFIFFVFAFVRQFSSKPFILSICRLRIVTKTLLKCVIWSVFVFILTPPSSCYFHLTQFWSLSRELTAGAGMHYYVIRYVPWWPACCSNWLLLGLDFCAAAAVFSHGWAPEPIRGSIIRGDTATESVMAVKRRCLPSVRTHKLENKRDDAERFVYSSDSAKRDSKESAESGAPSTLQQCERLRGKTFNGNAHRN